MTKTAATLLDNNTQSTILRTDQAVRGANTVN